MTLFTTRREREIRTLEEIENSIRRREKIHKLLICGLATLLALSTACHVAHATHKCKHHR